MLRSAEKGQDQLVGLLACQNVNELVYLHNIAKYYCPLYVCISVIRKCTIYVFSIMSIDG